MSDTLRELLRATRGGEVAAPIVPPGYGYGVTGQVTPPRSTNPEVNRAIAGAEMEPPQSASMAGPLTIPEPPPPSFGAADTGPVAIESGTLPGEEQVTTKDTLGRLSPEQQDSLRRRYASGGHAETIGFDDWLADNFGDIPPEERYQLMQKAAGEGTVFRLGKEPGLMPGENSDFAKGRQRADKPLPEGRDPKQYQPWQARRMQRNIHNPEVPMTPFGGTFTMNADGAMSSRAPNPAALAAAEQVAADPAQGPESDSYVIALAQAYNIDVSKYGNDIDVLRGDVFREKERHDRLSNMYDIAPTGMGAFRYVPNERARGMVAGIQGDMEARDLVVRYGHLLSPEEKASILADSGAEGAQQGRAQLRRTLRGIDADNRQAAVRQRAVNYNMSQDLRNPNYAPGMAIRSLIQAAQSGDPMVIGAVNDFYRNPRAGDRAAAMAMNRRSAEAAEEQARIEAGMGTGDAGDGDQPLATLLDDQLDAAMAMENPGEAIETIAMTLAKSAKRDEPSDQDRQRAVGIFHARLYARDPDDPRVSAYLLSVAQSGYDRFIDYATRSLDMSPEDARLAYNTLTGADKTAEERGQQAGAGMSQGVRDFGNSVGGFVRGFWGGIGNPGATNAPPSAWGSGT